MSSLQDWAEEVIAEHAVKSPFAPENGKDLLFKVGDDVIFTNDYGLEFQLKVIGLYQPESTTALYAMGYRYHVDDSCPWMPAKESSLRMTSL